MTVLHLVLGLHDGLGCLLGDGSSAPVEGRLARAPGEAGDPLHELRPARGVLTPAADARACAVERAEAARLADAVFGAAGMADARERLLQAIGAARAAGESLVLAIDARTAPLRKLPWELLEALRPSESALAGLRVARVAPAGGRRSPAAHASRIAILAWSPTPSDPACAEVLANLDRIGGSLRRCTLDRVDPRTPPEDGEGGPSFRSLHVVCHAGRAVARALPGVRDGARALWQVPAPGLGLSLALERSLGDSGRQPGDLVELRLDPGVASEGRRLLVVREVAGEQRVVYPVASEDWIRLAEFPLRDGAVVVPLVLEGPPGLHRYVVAVLDGALEVDWSLAADVRWEPVRRGVVDGAIPAAEVEVRVG